MGSSFIDQIRNSKLKHPTQPGFSKKKWNQHYDRHHNDSELDKNIYFAGLFFNSFLNDIRSKLLSYNDRSLNVDILRQAYTAIINRDYLVAINSFDEKIEKSQDRILTAGFFSETKVPTGVENISLNAIAAIEGSLEAVRYPLSDTFNDYKIDSTKKAKDLDLIQILGAKMNLAALYNLISILWGECLWNNWSIDTQNEDYNLINPPNSEKMVSRIVSEYRHESLVFEMAYQTMRIWKDYSNEQKNIFNNQKIIIGLFRQGRTKKFQLGEYQSETDLIRSVGMGAAAEELYWNAILEEPLPNYPTLTIREILSAWEVLYSLGRLILSKLPRNTSIQKISQLLNFSPKYKFQELQKAISKSTGFTYDKVDSIIKLCSFSGDLREDPWSKPIVPLDKKFFSVFVPSLIVTNRIRLIEAFMREGGLKLDERGYAFEEYVRHEIQMDFKESHYLKDTFVYPNQITFSCDNNEEQIDLLFIIGNMVFIGEIKCSLFPTAPIEIYRVSKVLEGAAGQAKRKSSFITRNLEIFFDKIGYTPSHPIEDFLVYPLVLTNLTFGAGFPIDGVPITDLRILNRYLEGKQKLFSTLDEKMDEKFSEICFYNSNEDAKKNFLSFIRKPLNIQMFTKMIDYELTPIPKLNEKDKGVAWGRFFINDSKLLDNFSFE